ncbi:MAG: AAA family ATPase [Thermoplasmata archaeon]
MKKGANLMSSKFSVDLSRINGGKVRQDEIAKIINKLANRFDKYLVESFLLKSHTRIDVFNKLPQIPNNIELFKEVYPEDIANSIEKFYELHILKSLNDTEKDIIYKIIRLPIVSTLSFSEKDVIEKLSEFTNNNKSLLKVCETVVGYYSLMKSNIVSHLILKDLSERDDFRSQSILLYGEPGCGKSWVGQIIADAINLPMIKIFCSSDDHLGVGGSPSNWSNSKESKIAQEMITLEKFPMIFVFDEVDKTGHTNEHYLIDTINHIIDPGNIKPYTDPYLQIPLYHLKTFIFILTANDIEKVPSYIRSRTTEIKIEPLVKEVLVESVLKKFEKETIHDMSLLRRLLNSDEVKEKILEMTKINNLDFRALRVILDSLLFRYYARKCVSSEKIEDFFKKELEEIIKSSGRKKEEKTIGFRAPIKGETINAHSVCLRNA